MVITLSDIEQRLARYVVRLRQEKNTARGITDRRQSTGEADIELMGMGAELALCKLLNVYPDLQADEYGTFDLISRHGWRVDVKATARGGSLNVAMWKSSKPADFYALMVGDFPTFRCTGIAPAVEVFTPGHQKDVGNGPFWAVPEHQLQSVDQWLQDYDTG